MSGVNSGHLFVAKAAELVLDVQSALQSNKTGISDITAAQWRWITSNENSRSDLSHAVYYVPLFAIIPTCLPFKFSWKECGKVCSLRQGICGVSDVWFLWKAPRGTVVSPEYKRQRYHKRAAAYLTDESSQSCQRHHSRRAPTLPNPPSPFQTIPLE